MCLTPQSKRQIAASCNLRLTSNVRPHGSHLRTMAIWKFQLLPARPDFLGVGWRMDSAGQEFEKSVNDALRYPFRFHKINKLVLQLGLTEPPKQDYVELLGVAIKQCPRFNLEHYCGLSNQERLEVLRLQTTQVFAWLQATFPDAQFIDVGVRNLGWIANPLQ